MNFNGIYAMDKLDLIFTKVISDNAFAKGFDIDASKYSNIEEGKRSLNPYVRAVAELVETLSKKIGEEESNMRIRNKVGPVVLNESDLQVIYRKIVASLSK